MLTRKELEQREYEILAPYALKSGDSEGRSQEEDTHPYRTNFQRDRDRIIHCPSFRRLEYKTQVFVNHEGDNYRTRLTHTMEVAQIGRTIARVMQLNEDFTEALGLAHDLGHTPFGHAGEEELDRIMKDEGGFEHNRQSRRIVKVLENNFRGLNLTREVTSSIIKHKTVYDNAGTHEAEGAFLETQVVNLADEISYNGHDLDDGIAAQVLTEDELRHMDIWKMAEECVQKEYPDLTGRHRCKRIIVSIINIYVTDLVSNSEKNLEKHGIGSIEDVVACPEQLISFSDEIESYNMALQSYLRKHLYQHSRIIRTANKSKRFVREIFAEYEQNPNSLPEDYQEWAAKEGVGLKRAIADYIAGMTDRYAQDEYMKLFHPYT